MHFLKKGQKIRAWVDPSPLIRAMPERKLFFCIDVFPSNHLYLDNDDNPNHQIPSLLPWLPLRLCLQRADHAEA